MGPIRGERVKIRQRGGDEIELIVSGDENYASYETPDGFPVIYDAASGRFFHARLAGGRFESTGVPADQPPPAGAQRHQQESIQVRREKSAAHQAARGCEDQAPPPSPSAPARRSTLPDHPRPS